MRPTADRVREAMFDVLDHLDLIEDGEIVDLFAGSGAIGIEAASRGASSVTFVESDRAVVAAIEANIASTRVGEICACRLVRSDVMTWARAGREHFDVAFIDPPYAYDTWPELLGIVPARFVVIESDKEVELPDRLVLHRTYRYGTTLVTMAMAREDGGVDP